MINKTLLSLIGVSVLSLAANLPSACAQGVISFNEDVFGTIAPTAPAGMLSATNWNDSFTLKNGQTGNDTFNNLVNSSGVATTLSLSTTALNLFQIQTSDPGANANGL